MQNTSKLPFLKYKKSVAQNSCNRLCDAFIPLALQLKDHKNLFVYTQAINDKKEKPDTLVLESFL
jgi:hypothetical protein